MTSIARLLLFCCALHTQVFAADIINLQLDSLQTDLFTTEAIELKYSPRESETPGLSIYIRKIDSPYFNPGFSFSLRCVDTTYTIQVVHCVNGDLHIQSPERKLIRGNLDFQINFFDFSGKLEMSAESQWGDVALSYHANNEQAWQIDMDTKALQLAFFSPLIESLLEEFNEHLIHSGQANIQAQFSGINTRINDVALNIDIEKLGIEGENVLDEVALQLQMDIQHQKDSWLFNNSLSLLAGEMYIQPGISILGDKPGFYIETSTSPGELRIKGSWSPEQSVVELQEFHYLHPDFFQLQGSTRIIFGKEVTLSYLNLHAVVPDLGLSYPVYIQPLLLQTNFSDLELSGTIDLSLDYQDSKLNTMKLLIEDVFLDDTGSRFSLSDLNSRLVLDNKPEAVESIVSWSGMSFYRLDFGAGDIVLESRGKDVKVVDWQDVTILDGALKIDEFSIRNLARSDFELKLGGELKPISMEALTHALGWTIFPGKLSGGISGLKYAHNSLELEGDISFSLFGGFLNIQDLKVENLFSSYSVLTTDIEIDKLDLEQLTDVFTFGKIEGSLSGRMDKLRLENWQPSYFEAEFATLIDDDKPHRISQKALENLNELGGGLSGTLSQGFLRFLPAYSYGRLGLSCRLNNGICELGGVEDDGDRFSILTKGGYLPPWVEVKGAGRSIRWADLIDGLKQIARGEVAIE